MNEISTVIDLDNAPPTGASIAIDKIGNVEIKNDLNVDGLIRAKPTTKKVCDASVEGGIYYNKDDRHFYGCDGTSWKRLD